MVVPPFVTGWAVFGLIVPFGPAAGVTVQVWTAAEQLAVVPPFDPAQLQVQGPEPVTALAVPVVQRSVVGALVRVVLFAGPQVPFIIGVNVAVTVQLAVMGPVV